MEITKEMFDQYLEANKEHNGKSSLDIESYNKTRLKIEEYIYIYDHFDILSKKFQKWTGLFDSKCNDDWRT